MSEPMEVARLSMDPASKHLREALNYWTLFRAGSSTTCADALNEAIRVTGDMVKRIEAALDIVEEVRNGATSQTPTAVKAAVLRRL